MHLKAAIDAHREELIALRRDIHRHPELGFHEHRTSAIIVRYLESLDLEVRRLARTGVVGVLRGRAPGPNLLLRADMDALPINEQTGLPFASEHPGLMHACGHDGHVAMLLVAAKILCSYRDRLAQGSITFAFQPNEEDAGAQAMIDEGLLDDPPIDAALALHLWAQLPTGVIGVAAGPVMASSEYFELVIRGRGGHGGAPHEAIDPILCAADVIQAIQAIQTREQSALRPTVITFGSVHAGTSPIVIPEQAVLAGSIRCLHEHAAETKDSFRRIVAAVCQAHRTQPDLRVTLGNSLMVNEAGLVELVRGVGGEVVGADGLTEDGVRMMVGEDFAELARRVPAALYLVGAGGASASPYPHHHPSFVIDEAALAVGVEMHVRAALRYLRLDP